MGACNRQADGERWFSPTARLSADAKRRVSGCQYVMHQNNHPIQI